MRFTHTRKKKKGHSRFELQRALEDAHEVEARAGGGHDARGAAGHHGQRAPRRTPLRRARPARRTSRHQHHALVRHLPHTPPHTASLSRYPLRSTIPRREKGTLTLNLYRTGRYIFFGPRRRNSLYILVLLQKKNFSLLLPQL